MALKKKTVKPKKVAPKKSKKRTPAVIPVGTKGKGKTYKSKLPKTSGKKNWVKPSNLDEIKEMLNKKPLGTSIGCGDAVKKAVPPTTHKLSCTTGVDSEEDLVSKWINGSTLHPVSTNFEKQQPTTDQMVRELKMRVTALEHELENKLPNDHGYDYPIDITVMNVSEKTLENVPLFNDNYRNQQDVVYGSRFFEGYSDVIKFKNAIGIGVSGNKEIGMIRVVSDSKMLSSYLKAVGKTMDGCEMSFILPLMIDPYQNQSCILQRNQKLSYNVGTNLIIKSLPPMTRFTYTIYFISEDYQKRMESLKKKINPQP